LAKNVERLTFLKE